MIPIISIICLINILKMKVKIRRFDKSLPMPVYKTPGSVAVDLYSRVDVEIPAGEIFYIPMNIAIEIPQGYFVLLAARSSVHKMGIQPINGVGIFDRDFYGDNDEYHFIVRNFTNDTVKIEKGTRLCQLLLMKYDIFEFEEVNEMGNPSRGGIGSTGTK